MTLRALLVPLLSVVGACDVFDESLYLNAGDGGTPLDTIVLADRCNGDDVPTVESQTGARATSTIALTDTFNSDISACTGSPEPGADGFFKVAMEQGDKWHFHLRVQDQLTANPALYVLRSCDERACSSETSLDECGTGRDEHLSYVATSTGTFLVGVDSRAAGGFDYEIEVVRTECGDNLPQHSETCDDGNEDAGDGCSPDCRAEIADGDREVEPNDEVTNANVAGVAPGGTVEVRGQLGGRCDFDMWAVDVPAGGSVLATMLDGNGNACGPESIAYRLELYDRNGHRVEGAGTPREPNTCPSIDATDTFSVDLDGPRTFLRVTTQEDQATPVDYRLSITVNEP